MSLHRALRPAWRCAVDGAPWPCVDARVALRTAFPEQGALAAYMARLMAVAADELGVAGPAALFPRFVAWAMGPEEGCRVCGRPRHTVVAGVPPRLSPCRVAVRTDVNANGMAGNG